MPTMNNQTSILYSSASTSNIQEGEGSKVFFYGGQHQTFRRGKEAKYFLWGQQDVVLRRRLSQNVEHI